MKLDTNFSHIKVCPETEIELTNNQVCYRGGICPKCGHTDRGTFTHYKIIVGKWNRPSLFERWFQGKELEFIPKEQDYIPF